MKRWLATGAALCMTMAMLTGCGGETADNNTQSNADTSGSAAVTTNTAAAVPEDGVYSADFNTDNPTMFHANEADDGKGTLTVKDGKMTLHVSLTSKNIVNLFVGKAADAQKDGAELLQPTVDTVTYSDGLTEKVNGFDIPVPALDAEFDVALIGKKGKWYDHKVSVSNPVLVSNDTTASNTSSDVKEEKLDNGTYMMQVTMEGGSGRASIESPAKVVVENDTATATIVWSSPNYDYMKVDGETYQPVNTDGNSIFEIPVTAWDSEMTVIADTTAMSTPHEITYTLTFDTSTAEPAS